MSFCDATGLPALFGLSRLENGRKDVGSMISTLWTLALNMYFQTAKPPVLFDPPLKGQENAYLEARRFLLRVDIRFRIKEAGHPLDG